MSSSPKVVRFLFQSALEHALGVLQECGIRPIVLKGPHLAYTVYDDPTDRDWADLDLLVPPPSFDQALEALTAAGYLAAPPLPHRIATGKAYYCRQLKSPLGVQVELHRDVVPHGAWTVDLQAWAQRAEPFHMGTVEAWGLGTEDLLLHLCLHIAKSHFAVEEKHWRDIGLLVQKRRVDWAAFLAQTGRTRCRTGCYYALRAAIHRTGAEIPPTVMQGLRPGPLRRWWLDRFLAPEGPAVQRFSGRWAPAAALCMRLPLMDRWRDSPVFVARYSALRFRDLTAFLLYSMRKISL